MSAGTEGECALPPGGTLSAENDLYFTVTPESSTGASSDKVCQYLQVLAPVVTQLSHLKIAIPTIKYSQSVLTSVLAPVVTEIFLK